MTKEDYMGSMTFEELVGRAIRNDIFDTPDDVDVPRVGMKDAVEEMRRHGYRNRSWSVVFKKELLDREELDDDGNRIMVFTDGQRRPLINEGHCFPRTLKAALELIDEADVEPYVYITPVFHRESAEQRIEVKTIRRQLEQQAEENQDGPGTKAV